ncbi:MAG: hypothetical protein WC803_02215 [Sphingomonas sp.]|jgi:hypothetical protein
MGAKVRLMSLAAALLIIAQPAFAEVAGGRHERTAPELSDIALFLMAAAGIYFARRALRARFARRRADVSSEQTPQQ